MVCKENFLHLKECEWKRKEKEASLMKENVHAWWNARFTSSIILLCSILIPCLSESHTHSYGMRNILCHAPKFQSMHDYGKFIMGPVSKWLAAIVRISPLKTYNTYKWYLCFGCSYAISTYGAIIACQKHLLHFSRMIHCWCLFVFFLL